MHNYSIDTDSRKKALIIMLVISVIISSIVYAPLNTLVESISDKFSIFGNMMNTLNGIGVETNLFSILVIFSALHTLFSKCLWKCKWLQKIHGVPDLSGEWTGALESSYKDENDEHIKVGTTFTIKQDWYKIHIYAKFDNSSSNSNSAYISTDVAGGAVLTFSYSNDSNEVDWKTKNHNGWNSLKFTEPGSLNGRYFTNREDGTHGTIDLLKTMPILETINEQ
ncbi:MAG: hypothetical protein IJR60_03975 [Eubacterium sp.]|nr:hypothetical protein [Eubacterium sp.]